MGNGYEHGRIVVEAGGPVSVVSLHGEHDHSTRARLESLVTALLDDSDATAVVVDLSETDFMNVPVLGALKRAHSHADDRGKRLIVVLPETGRAIVRRLFEVTEAHSMFDVSPSLEAALEAISGGSSG
jgi:anti-anti-sigma factor